MRVILLKRLVTPHNDYAVGTILNYSKGPGEKLIEGRKALKYNGDYPPKKKMKTELFKPKGI